jgi:hypothetical protein
MYTYKHIYISCHKHLGPDGINTGSAYANIGNYYSLLADSKQISLNSKKEFLQLSITKFKEAVRIFRKIFGPDHPRVLDASSDLSSLVRKLTEV